MANLVDVLLAKYDQEKAQARKHEELRSNTTNFIIAIAAGVLAFAGSSDPEYQAASGLFLLILGLFGALLSRKHYERFHYHTRFAQAYDEKLGELVEGSRVDDYQDRIVAQKKAFRFTSRWRLNWLWTAIHFFVSLIGTFLLVSSWPAEIGGRAFF